MSNLLDTYNKILSLLHEIEPRDNFLNQRRTEDALSLYEYDSWLNESEVGINEIIHNLGMTEKIKRDGFLNEYC